MLDKQYSTDICRVRIESVKIITLQARDIENRLFGGLVLFELQDGSVVQQLVIHALDQDHAPNLRGQWKIEKGTLKKHLNHANWKVVMSPQ